MVFGTKEFDEFNGSGLNTKMNIQIGGLMAKWAK
jgi:hypothetical protein